MIFEKMFDVVKEKLEGEEYERKGSNPHANFEQSHPRGEQGRTRVLCESD